MKSYAHHWEDAQKPQIHPHNLLTYLSSVPVSSKLKILTWRKQGGSQGVCDSQEPNKVHKVFCRGHLSNNILWGNRVFSGVAAHKLQLSCVSPTLAGLFRVIASGITRVPISTHSKLTGSVSWTWNNLSGLYYFLFLGWLEISFPRKGMRQGGTVDYLCAIC